MEGGAHHGEDEELLHRHCPDHNEEKVQEYRKGIMMSTSLDQQNCATRDHRVPPDHDDLKIDQFKDSIQRPLKIMSNSLFMISAALLGVGIAGADGTMTWSRINTSTVKADFGLIKFTRSFQGIEETVQYGDSDRCLFKFAGCEKCDRVGTDIIGLLSMALTSLLVGAFVVLTSATKPRVTEAIFNFFLILVFIMVTVAWTHWYYACHSILTASMENVRLWFGFATAVCTSCFVLIGSILKYVADRINLQSCSSV
mmetsp:Transcript_9545/g.23505  ORF Transcript_9545/g.23505 Transcript_9545/m.23505 type:complete len:255 (+) Transcript_9545:43-807(+)